LPRFLFVLHSSARASALPSFLSSQMTQVGLRAMRGGGVKDDDDDDVKVTETRQKGIFRQSLAKQARVKLWSVLQLACS
jgi:hypothetical protein